MLCNCAILRRLVLAVSLAALIAANWPVHVGAAEPAVDDLQFREQLAAGEFAPAMSSALALGRGQARDGRLGIACRSTSSNRRFTIQPVNRQPDRRRKRSRRNLRPACPSRPDHRSCDGRFTGRFRPVDRIDYRHNRADNLGHGRGPRLGAALRRRRTLRCRRHIAPRAGAGSLGSTCRNAPPRPLAR